MHARGEDWWALVAIPEADRPAAWEGALGADLVAIATRGYAEESNEFEAGTSAIAAAVLDHTGAAVAALCISGPSARFGSTARDAAAPLLIESANEIATDLGMRPPVVPGRADTMFDDVPAPPTDAAPPAAALRPRRQPPHGQERRASA